MPWITQETCTGCSLCIKECPVDAIALSAEGLAKIDEAECIRCGRCHDACPQNAVRHDGERIPQEVAANLQWVRRLLGHFHEPTEQSAFMERMTRFFKKQKKVSERTLAVIAEAAGDPGETIDAAIWELSRNPATDPTKGTTIDMESKVKELVVISGKGGTGKTSIVASFAALTEKVVLADCDVDAADLHLVLEPKVMRRESFSGGKRARIRTEHCIACGKCEALCQFDAIDFDGPSNGKLDKTFRIDPIACEGCGVCAWFCAENAIEFAPAVNGEWYVSDTRHGPMVHAKLGIAEENSGKLVSTVRKEAGAIAQQRGLELVLIDGSPGIGCPVIASITGADLVLIVTEPTLSGLHDLGRVADVARHFEIPGWCASTSGTSTRTWLLRSSVRLRTGAWPWLGAFDTTGP